MPTRHTLYAALVLATGCAAPPAPDGAFFEHSDPLEQIRHAHSAATASDARARACAMRPHPPGCRPSTPYRHDTDTSAADDFHRSSAPPAPAPALPLLTRPAL